MAAGAGLLCLDVPSGTEFGMDCISWTVGEQFKVHASETLPGALPNANVRAQGMKMIPCGLHLMTWSAGHESRMGVFLQLQRAEVVVHRWERKRLVARH